METENPEKLMERIEKEVIPSMMQKMNSVVASASLLKNAKGPNKRIANESNQN